MASVLVVFGTRPEAIKMAPVVKALRAHPGLEVRIAVTAQHRQMLDQVLILFELAPDDDLDLMRPGQQLGDLCAGVLGGMQGVLERRRPDLVLVHGDTSTTLAAALAAFYQHIPVAHVEAGLRTGDLQAPWPEEMNRRLTATLATLHFAPTAGAAGNLQAEGIVSGVHVTGNTVIDALLDVVGRIEADPALRRSLQAALPYPSSGRKMLLVTGHRRENFGAGLEDICLALREIALRGDIDIVYPVHLNPNVQEPIRRLLADCPAVHLIDPQDYLPFVWLMMCADMILTDSGGVQEEAPSLGKPVLVMREVTERPEALAAGTVRLVGADRARIIDAVCGLLDAPEQLAGMARRHNPYGDGHAADRIATTIVAWLRGDRD